ncbi:MAG: ATP-binding cassette domain-containing protein [Candidatus Helarchaeota archaeon]
MMQRVFNIDQMGKSLGVSSKEILKILKEIILNRERAGIIIESDMLFYQFTQKELDNLITKFNNSKFTLNEGLNIFSKIIKDFKIDLATLKIIIVQLLKNQQLQGIYNNNKTEFIGFNVIYQTILRTLFNTGKIRPREVALDLGLSEQIIRDSIVELQSNDKYRLKGIYINEGEEYIIYESLKNEILDLIDNEFGITIPLISSQLSISEDVTSKIIDDLLYNELLYIQDALVGNQIQYISHRKISEEISTALKLSNRKDISEIASRFNISIAKTKEIIRDLITQGRVIGYIDERMNEFVKESQQETSRLVTSVPLNTILNIENITVKTKSKVILDNISLYLQENKILGIVGPSGTGKSTFLKAIIGQMPLKNGKITISGYNIKDLSKISRIMGYVPQDLSTIYPNFTILKNMEHFGKQYELPLKEIKKRAKKILKELKIWDLVDEPVKNLSGGEKRRASIAISIIHYPKILFLDEPTSGLDPVFRKEFWKTLINLNENYQMTLVVVTHYPDELQFVSKAVLFGKKNGVGKIIAVGTPKELIASLPGEGRVILVELKKPIKNSLKIIKESSKIESILEERKNEKFRIFTNKSMKDVVNSIVTRIKLSDIRNISQVEANMVDFFRLVIENQ